MFGQNPLKDVVSRVFTRMLCSKNLTLWPWKSIGFQILLRTKYVPSFVKIHWRMLILEWSQGCYGRTVALLYPFATSLARRGDNKIIRSVIKFNWINWRRTSSNFWLHYMKIYPSEYKTGKKVNRYNRWWQQLRQTSWE
jgi:hypothetical protein